MMFSGLRSLYVKPDRVQIAQCGQDFEHVADGLGHRQLLALGLLERRAADVLHHDVADGIAVLVRRARRSCRSSRFPGWVTSARNWRSAIAIFCASASPECTRPLSTTGRSLTLWSNARYTQPNAAVGDAALDLVLIGDHVARTQLRQKRIRAAAVRAPALRQRMAVGQSIARPGGRSSSRTASTRRPPDSSSRLGADPWRVLAGSRPGHRRGGESATTPAWPWCGPGVRCPR